MNADDTITIPILGMSDKEVMSAAQAARETLIHRSSDTSQILGDTLAGFMQDISARVVIPTVPPILISRVVADDGNPETLRWLFSNVLTKETVLDTCDAAEARAKVNAILNELPPKQRARVFDAVLRQVNAGREAARNAIRVRMKDADKLVPPEELDAMGDEVELWFRGGLHLQKVQATGFHRFRTAFRKAEISSLLGKMRLDDINDSVKLAQPFLVEHDWAAALAKAADMDEGGIKMPYDAVAFEFRISGKHVIALMSEDRMAPFIELSTGTWCLPRRTYRRVGDDWTWLPVGEEMPGTDVYVTPLSDLIFAQVRAICIALDAELAVHETIRAPERLNRERIKHGKLPMSDYHVVRLSHRSRATPLEADAEHAERNRMRAHLVRGHWRHFSDHRTWIRWHFRGDIDLGFVDKEYRL